MSALSLGCTVWGAGVGVGAPYVGHRELKGELLIGMFFIDNVSL